MRRFCARPCGVSFEATGCVSPKHVHSFLELIPLMAISFIATLHWPQFLATFSLGGKSDGGRLRIKQKPLGKRYVAALLGAIALFEGLPYLEKLQRCLRVAAAPLGGKEPPPIARGRDDKPPHQRRCR
jgi:hypothetical protein